MIFLLLLLFAGEAFSDNVLLTRQDIQPSRETPSQQTYPSCFTQDSTWAPDESQGHLSGIETLYSCQQLCLEANNCHQFTWYNELAIPFPFGCFLYDDPTTEYPCTNCVSGPESCTCSGSYSCQFTEDNLVGEFPHVATEILCQDHCSQTEQCKFYSWFEEGVFPNLCIMFSSCEEKVFNCDTCHSGPVDCENVSIMTTTAVTTTQTTTESNLDCDLPESQEHGDWFCPPTPELSTCHLECHPGYVSSNFTVVVCIKGKWNSFPRCVEAIALITGNHYSPYNTVEIYGNGLHKKLPDLPESRQGHSLQLVDSSIILCGGDGTSTSCIAMTGSQEWVHHSTTKLPRWGHSSVSMLGQLHLLGGGYTTTEITTEYLVPPSTQWTTGWDALKYISEACAAKIGPDVFILTGHGSSVISYNVTSGAAARLQDLIQETRNHGCCSVRGKEGSFRGVLVAGGGCNTCSQMYDIQAGQWSTTGELTTARWGIRMVVLGDNIFALGGWDRSGSKSSVDRFNMTTRTWSAAEEMLEAKTFYAVTGVPPTAVGIGHH